MLQGYSLLLASKSPRRRQLIGELGLPVEVVNIDVDERLPHPVPSPEVAEALARLKADGYPACRLLDRQLLITADTVVVMDNRALGKPKSREEAFGMLSALSGRTHHVYTGVCVKSKGRTHSFTECTEVCFEQLAEDEILHYIDRFQPFDKAGSYGIQEWIGMIGIRSINGCYYNVMGLPVARLYKELKVFVQ